MKNVILTTAILFTAALAKAQTEPANNKQKDPDIVVLENDEYIASERPEAVDYATSGTSNPDWKVTLCNSTEAKSKPGAPNTVFKFIPYQNTYVRVKCNFKPAKYPNIKQVDVRCYRMLLHKGGKHEFASQERMMMSAYKNINAVELSVEKPGRYEIQVIDFDTKKLLYSTEFVNRQ